jgi:hypothetical protein
MSMFHSTLPLVSGVEGVQVGDDRVGGAVAEDGHRDALAADAGRMLVDRAQLLGRQGADVGRALLSAEVGHRAVPARAVEAEDGVDRQRLGDRGRRVVGVEGPAARLVAADRRLQQCLDLGDGPGGQDVVARARDVLDAQAAARQPPTDVLLGGRGDPEALRVLRRGEEVVVARAGAIEEAAQEGVLGGGVGWARTTPTRRRSADGAAPVRSAWVTARGTLATSTRSAAAALATGATQASSASAQMTLPTAT